VAPQEGAPVIVRANGALERLAEATGGLFVPASLSQEDERAILRWYRERFGNARTREKVVTQRIELFYYPLALALLVLPFALYSFGGGRKTLIVALLLAGGRSLPLEAGLLDFSLIEKGEKAYEKGDYRESAEAFGKLAIRSDRPEAWFDLGNAYYRSGRYKMACDAYGRVVTTDPRIESAKLYNLGNCYAKLGDLEKAAAFYRKVLAIWDDPDARYNLKVVEAALAERKKRPRTGEKGKKEAENERRKSGRGGQESDEKGRMPGARPPEAKKPQKISPNEERKWMELIENQPLKTRLYPLQPPRERDDAKPW
jgi:Ca-activated chloride channel family protein